jgi:hypothetical protein
LKLSAYQIPRRNNTRQGETMAAYRYFDNHSVHWRAMLDLQTEQRIAAQGLVVCQQDTPNSTSTGSKRFLGPASYEEA